MSRLTRVKKVTTIAATFAMALGIGFVMQYDDADAARYQPDAHIELRKPVLLVDYSPLTALDSMTPKAENPASAYMTSTSNLAVDPDSVKLVALIEDVEPVDSQSLFAQTQPNASPRRECGISAVTAPNATGSVTMTIASECRADMLFTVSHNGLSFSAQTDAEGTAKLTVPALSEDATFFITFNDGKSFATSTYAPDASLYNRVVFQWEGHEGSYLQSDDANTVLLGANVGAIPRFAQIYTFPADTDMATGLADIDVIAQVTDLNCGQVLVAESFSIFPGVVDLAFKDIRITLPSCDQVGATLELKKVLGEQTLAAR